MLVGCKSVFVVDVAIAFLVHAGRMAGRQVALSTVCMVVKSCIRESQRRGTCETCVVECNWLSLLVAQGNI